jgi:hypothetical protein
MGDEIKHIIKEILNDRDIFFYHPGAELFGKEEMNKLKKKHEMNIEEFIVMVKDKIRIIDEEIKNKKRKLQNTHDHKQKMQIRHFIRNREKCQRLARSMIDNSSNSFLMMKLMDYFNDFGFLSCSISNSLLDDIRKVIEETNLQITEEYVLYKIKKNRRAKMPLKSLLEYIERLYASNISLEERAFIIGKLSSFVELPQVMIDE